MLVLQQRPQHPPKNLLPRARPPPRRTHPRVKKSINIKNLSSPHTKKIFNDSYDSTKVTTHPRSHAPTHHARQPASHHQAPPQAPPMQALTPLCLSFHCLLSVTGISTAPSFYLYTIYKIKYSLQHQPRAGTSNHYNAHAPRLNASLITTTPKRTFTSFNTIINYGLYL